MRERTRPPAHPGAILKRHYLKPLHLTVSDAASGLKVSRKTISKLVNERGSVTPDMALRLSRAFGTSPELWLNLQQSYDLWRVSHESRAWERARVFMEHSRLLASNSA